MGYIYLTTNLINNKKYIGQCTKNSVDTVNYKGGGKLLLKAFKKYGKENFKKEILLEDIFTKQELNYIENYYIRFYNADNDENYYNIASGGYNGFSNNKSIYQYSEDGLLLETFNSLSKASTVLKVSIATLSKAAIGNFRVRKSYYVTYDTLEVKARNYIRPKGIKCYLLNIITSDILEYKSQTQASEFLNVSIQRLLYYLNNKVVYNGFLILDDINKKEFSNKVIKNTKSGRKVKLTDVYGNELIFDTMLKAGSHIQSIYPTKHNPHSQLRNVINTGKVYNTFLINDI